ncbi:MAG: hypothetical protein AAGD86_05105 [Pseudomonadota bacterium]
MTSSTRWYHKSEMVMAASAVIVSVAAVVVAVYSAWIDRSFARAATWPHLEIYRSYADDRLSHGVSNRGTGPAIVHYAVLEDDGTAYPTWFAWLDARHTVPEEGFIQSHISTRVLSPEQQVEVFSTNNAALARAVFANDGMNLRLCYCSVFDECWLTDGANRPERVASCDTQPATPFEQ